MNVSKLKLLAPEENDSLTEKNILLQYLKIVNLVRKYFEVTESNELHYLSFNGWKCNGVMVSLRSYNKAISPYG